MYTLSVRKIDGIWLATREKKKELFPLLGKHENIYIYIYNGGGLNIDRIRER